MLTDNFKYKVQIKNSDGLITTFEDEIECEFLQVFNRIMEETLNSLGNVKPIQVTRILITRIKKT